MKCRCDFWGSWGEGKEGDLGISRLVRRQGQAYFPSQGDILVEEVGEASLQGGEELVVPAPGESLGAPLGEAHFPLFQPLEQALAGLLQFPAPLGGGVFLEGFL